MNTKELTPEEIAGIRAINNGVWVCNTKRYIVSEVKPEEDAPSGDGCGNNVNKRCSLGGECLPRIGKHYVRVRDEMEYINGVPLNELRNRK